MTVHSVITYKQWHGINTYLHPKHWVHIVFVCVCVRARVYTYIHK